MAAISSPFTAPVPLSDIENVLAWVDTFKLSRPTKKINRDFSDAVLLAEILAIHYPKLVEMHNYPPRNSHALKLNNWMTLNRKVLKKLKLTLCCSTMEQLANCAPGIIERVLIMVRDKIKRDEDLERSAKEAENNQSSGGSYYEACGDEEHVLVVPVKTRVNGVLETMQQKVVNLEAYNSLKLELKDAKDTSDLLKQKVEHLDSLIKLKDERIIELQKQLERKQLRRKEVVETLQNSLSVPFEEVPPPTLEAQPVILAKKTSEPIKIPSKTAIEEVNILTPVASTIKKPNVVEVKTVLEPNDSKSSLNNISSHIKPEPNENEVISNKSSTIELKISQPSTDIKRQSVIIDHCIFKVPADIKKQSKSNMELKKRDSNVSNDITAELKKSDRSIDINNEVLDEVADVDRINSDVFKEASGGVIIDSKPDEDEFKDSEGGSVPVDTISSLEIKNVTSTQLKESSEGAKVAS